MPRIVFKYNPKGFVLVGDNRYMAKSEIKPLGLYPSVGFPAEDGNRGTLYRRHYRKWKIDGDHIVTSYMEWETMSEQNAPAAIEGASIFSACCSLKNHLQFKGSEEFV